MGKYREAANEAGRQTNEELFRTKIDIQDMLKELHEQNREPQEPSTWNLSPKYRRILIAILTGLAGLFVVTLQAQNKGMLILPQGEGAGGDSLGNVIPATEILIGQGTNLARSTDSLTWNAGLEVIGPVFITSIPTLDNANTDVLVRNAGTGRIDRRDVATFPFTNFVNANLSGTADRTHDFNGFDLTINDLDALLFERTSGASSIGMSSSGIQLISPSNNILLSIGSGSLELTTNGTGGDLIFDAGDIFLENPLSLDSESDTVLVRNNVTGEIMARSVSTISDKLGTAFTTGRLIYGDGTTSGTSSANLFWDNSSSELAIGHTSPAGDLHVISTDPTNRSSLIGQNDNSATAFTSTFPALSLRNNNTTANNYVRMNFQDASSTAAASIASQITDHTNDYGTLEFWTRGSGGFSQKMVITENGRIGIGGTPGTSSMVEITSTTGALTVPRMTSTQRDALTPVAGMIIYNTTTATFQGYTSSWTNL